MYYYSPKSKGFFHSSVHTSIPDDAISIDNEKYTELFNAINAGYEILVNGTTLSVSSERQINITWKDIRRQRNAKLKNSDYTQLTDWPGDKSAWTTYRQQLRDIPQMFSDPISIIWPEQPDD